VVRSILTPAIVIALVYLGLCATLFIFQRSLIYFPQPRSSGNAADTIALSVDGAELIVTARVQSGPQALLYFGGNAEDASYNLPALSAAFPEHAVYLMNYRGYGGSSGKPTEAALFADALALFDKVGSDHRHIIVVGRSLGSGVAVYLASQRPVARLVLVTPYDSIQEIAARQFRLFPVRWLLLDKFESWRYAPQITVPTLVVAAEYDEVIPRSSAEALFGRFAAGVAALKIIAGTGHNTISESPEYIPILQGVR